MAGLFGEEVAPMAATPRYYQQEAIDADDKSRKQGFQRRLIVLATGLGKTNVMAWQMQRHKHDGKMLAIVHRDELIQQIKSRVQSIAPEVKVTQHGAGERCDFGADLCVASVQSVGRADSNIVERFAPSVVWTDEAHRSAARSYQEVYLKAGCLDGSTQSIGVTATPHRMDNRALFGHDQTPYQVVSYSKTLADAIKEGWLCDIAGYRRKSSVDLRKVRTLMGDYDISQLSEAINVNMRNILAYDTWADVANGKQTIVFCCDIKHAMAVTECFQLKGVPAEMVHGKMHKDERRAVMQGFRENRVKVLINVEIATEGVDLPNCECVLILRPTKSFALYTQMVGRGLRTEPGCIDGLETREHIKTRLQRIGNSRKPECIVIEIVDEEGEDVKQETPTVAGIVGLPPKLDLRGKKTADALLILDDISKEALAVLMHRELDMSTLTDALQKVSILDELRVADQVIGNPSLSWINLSADVQMMHLSCGNGRSATLREDATGQWHLRMESKEHSQEFIAGRDVDEAIGRAEATIKARWADCVGLVKRAQKWRKESPSPAQIKYIRSFKEVDEGILAKLTKGEASQLISLLENKKAGR
jgi:superfamily II DNA or RNA helicase